MATERLRRIVKLSNQAPEFLITDDLDRLKSELKCDIQDSKSECEHRLQDQFQQQLQQECESVHKQTSQALETEAEHLRRQFKDDVGAVTFFVKEELKSHAEKTQAIKAEAEKAVSRAAVASLKTDLRKEIDASVAEAAHLRSELREGISSGTAQAIILRNELRQEIVAGTAEVARLRDELRDEIDAAKSICQVQLQRHCDAVETRDMVSLIAEVSILRRELAQEVAISDAKLGSLQRELKRDIDAGMSEWKAQLPAVVEALTATVATLRREFKADTEVVAAMVTNLGAEVKEEFQASATSFTTQLHEEIGALELRREGALTSQVSVLRGELANEIIAAASKVATTSKKELEALKEETAAVYDQVVLVREDLEDQANAAKAEFNNLLCSECEVVEVRVRAALDVMVAEIDTRLASEAASVDDRLIKIERQHALVRAMSGHRLARECVSPPGSPGHLRNKSPHRNHVQRLGESKANDEGRSK